MKLWTAVITAFITLLATLGLVNTASAAAVAPQTETARSAKPSSPVRVPATSHWAWSRRLSLPPTMKQRIQAEAHDSSPSCRHRPLSDASAPAEGDEEETEPADPAAPRVDLT